MIKRNSILKFHLTLDVCEGSVGGFHQIDSFEGRACRVTLEETVASNDCRNCCARRVTHADFMAVA